jgi:cytochrome b561
LKPRTTAFPTRGIEAPDRSRYSRTAMLLHWLIAVMILVNIGLAWSADYLSDEGARSVIDVHKSIGITVLGLALLRILWRISHRPPPLSHSFAPWERTAAHLAHLALYGLMLALPLSGWLHDSAWKDAATHPMRWFNLFVWPRVGWVMDLDPQFKEQLHNSFGTLHTWLGYLLFALLALHIGGALKHEWLDHESVLRRMLPWQHTGRDT